MSAYGAATPNYRRACLADAEMNRRNALRLLQGVRLQLHEHAFIVT
jgi:hypothetical protein